MRARCANWEREEKAHLLELVSSRIEIIEDKRVDADASKKKEEQWEEITKVFGAKYGVREKKKLKEQYQRLKLRAKAEYRDYQKSRKATGGGPPPKPPGPLSEMLINLMPGEFVRPTNPFDEDSTQK